MKVSHVPFDQRFLPNPHTWSIHSTQHFKTFPPKLYTTLHPISSGHSSLTHSKTKRNPLKSKVLEHSWLSNNGGVLQNMQAELPTFL